MFDRFLGAVFALVLAVIAMQLLASIALSALHQLARTARPCGGALLCAVFLIGAGARLVRRLGGGAERERQRDARLERQSIRRPATEVPIEAGPPEVDHDPALDQGDEDRA